MRERLTLRNIFDMCRIAARKKSLIIFSPYFDEDKMRDGYFRRVKVSDDLLEDTKRIYLDFEDRQKKTTVIIPNDDTYVIKFSNGKLAERLLSVVLLVLCGRVYCESVWQVRKKLFSIPFMKVYVDVHGVVPEEEFLYGRYDAAQKYGDTEKVVVKKAKHLFCVTQAMIDHFENKYGDEFKAPASVLPIFDDRLVDSESQVLKKELANGKPTVTYAGGIFKWQRIDDMQEAMRSQPDIANYEIYTPTPDEFWKGWRGSHDGITVESVSPQELTEKIYPRCHYGFVLRDDIAVNNVACPTKIPEYLSFGIIPIVDTPNIGDFARLGMRYLTLDDFSHGKLYPESERLKLVSENYECIRRYVDLYRDGVKTFKKIMLEGQDK